MIQELKLQINDEVLTIQADPTKRLLDVLRDELGLLGSKEGCGEGECGACGVLMDQKLINSCLIAIGAAVGKRIVTIEGFQKTRRFEILQEAFAEAGAVQCGFCTPGMIMAAEALLSAYAKPTEEQIREGISGNLCRCTGYNMIVEAVEKASLRGEGIW